MNKLDIQDSLASGGSIGIIGALQILFIGLKLVGIIDWSWFMIFVPTWGPIILILCMIALTLFIGAIIFGMITIADLIKR